MNVASETLGKSSVKGVKQKEEKNPEMCRGKTVTITVLTRPRSSVQTFRYLRIRSKKCQDVYTGNTSLISICTGS